ncbi:hypothetical protein L1987_54205 [Smallanthus sonchifolius]|uniref:Uncharacterized protein n=1 Tax=Smallanthus sonchifolius TaxID=185202 RepID=A0ACB9E7N0_9ASTR|nr:hypothetical protein L1987_54205 [Smallanthus sonchifolius]
MSKAQIFFSERVEKLRIKIVVLGKCTNILVVQHRRKFGESKEIQLIAADVEERGSRKRRRHPELIAVLLIA